MLTKVLSWYPPKPRQLMCETKLVSCDRYVEQRQEFRVWKDVFQKAYNKVETAIEPLLHGWLRNANNGECALHRALHEAWFDARIDADDEDFRQIRVACLPEVLLAYNMILNVSSHYLSRDLLLKSMDLAAQVAAENSGLAECFIAAKRMPELVDSFALLSKTIIRADGRGAKAGKGKKKRNGETLDLWTVRAPSD